MPVNRLVHIRGSKCRVNIIPLTYARFMVGIPTVGVVLMGYHNKATCTEGRSSIDRVAMRRTPNSALSVPLYGGDKARRGHV